MPTERQTDNSVNTANEEDYMRKGVNKMTETMKTEEISQPLNLRKMIRDIDESMNLLLEMKSIAESLSGNYEELTESARVLINEFVCDPDGEPEQETYSTADLVRILRASETTIRELRKAGMLEGIKIGHGFVYGAETVREFFSKYKGYDLSSPERIQAAADAEKVLQKKRAQRTTHTSLRK